MGGNIFPFGRGMTPPPPSWLSDTVYRGKPAPVVTSVWYNVDNVYTELLGGPYNSRSKADFGATFGRLDVLRIDTCNGVSTAHLEGLE